jgi:F1F0 ATPase subunit 2
MTINELMTLGLAWIAGGALGLIFFGGLWWSVRKGLGSGTPVVWFFAGLILRVGLTLAGFYFVGADDWQRLAACLLGFVMARQAVTRLARTPEKKQMRTAPEASHAP